MFNDALQADLAYTYKNISEEERIRLNDSTIFITGCAGFLGFYYMHFFYRYCEELHFKRIICLDNFILGRPKWLDIMAQDKHFYVQKFDIIKDRIEDIPQAAEADYIIHMASIASPHFYRRYPIETLDANIWGLRRLLDFYADKTLKGFLFYSSSEVYGNPDPVNIPTDEEYYGNVSCTGPRACYDESKRFGETMCKLFSQKYNMPVTVVRPFNNYGPGMKINDQRVPADFAKNVLEGKDIVILSSGSPKRTFCYIADAITGYLKAMAYGKYDYFNIGIETPEITIKELADIYQEAGKEILGYKGNIRYQVSDDNEYLTNNPQRRCPKIDKARHFLGYAPKITVENGVRRFLRFIQESGKENLEW